jgi:hypothetical protein
VTHTENVDGILADGRDDSVLVSPLATLAVEQLVHFLGELVAFSGDRTPPKINRGT